jgi:NitT/TauT family transport system substrate-binding protein
MSQMSLDRRAFFRSSLGAFAMVTGASAVAGAQTKIVLRIRQDTNVAYLGRDMMAKYLPTNYAIDWVDLGSKGMSAFVAMQRGLIDYNSGGYPYLVSAIDNDQQLVCVSGLAGGSQRVIVQADAGVKSLSDLKGKTIATPKGSGTDMKLIAALEKAGLDADKDVERLDVGNMPGVRAALESRRAIAGVMWEPSGSQLLIENKNFVMLDDLVQSAWRSHGGLFVKQSLIDQRPEEVQAVVTATVKGVDFLKKNPDQWVEKARQVSGLSEEICKLATSNCIAMYEIPMRDQKTCAEIMYKSGITKQDISKSIDKYINYEFLVSATGMSKEALGYS